MQRAERAAEGQALLADATAAKITGQHDLPPSTLLVRAVHDGDKVQGIECSRDSMNWARSCSTLSNQLSVDEVRSHLLLGYVMANFDVILAMSRGASQT